MSASEQARPPLLDQTWLEQLRDRLQTASGLLLCLDFDGTLAPIVDNPDEASITRGARVFLDELAGDDCVAVAIVSGRALADLQSRVDIEGIHYAGNHGLEWDDGDGRTVLPDAREVRPELAAVVTNLQQTVGDIPGCHVEDKRLTATVHVRQVPADRRGTVVETVEETIEATDGLRWSSGKEIVEIRPDIPAGKDCAIGRLRDRYPDHLPLFVGDDVTDEAGFRSVVNDGYGILVGDRVETAATVRVPNPDAVTMLLGWVQQLAVHQPGSTTR